jgi:hypothetical protein
MLKARDASGSRTFASGIHLCVLLRSRLAHFGVDLKPGDVGRQWFWYEGSELWNESNKNRYERMARSAEQHSYQNAEDEKDDKDQNYQRNFPTHLAFELRAAV